MTPPTDSDQPDHEQSLPDQTGADHPGWGSAPTPPPSNGGPTYPGPSAPAPGYPPPPAYPPHGYAPPAHPGFAPLPTNGKAVASMVVGIVSIVACYIGFIIGIVAISLAVSARKDFQQHPGRFGGDGMATAGLVTGIVGTAIWGLVVLFWFGLGVAGTAGGF